MFSFIPYRYLIIKTNLPKEKAAEVLRDALDRLTPIRDRYSSFDPVEFSGHVTPQNFKLHQIKIGRNSFRPDLYGHFEETASGVDVHARVCINPVVLAFLGIIFISFICFSTFTLPEVFRTHRLTSDFLQTILSILFFYFMVMIGYTREADRTCLFIEQVYLNYSR